MSKQLKSRQSREKSSKPRFIVKTSPTHGKGLFAATRIRAHEMIGVFEGVPTKRDGMHVLWLMDDDGSELGLRVHNDLRYANHSSRPNAEARYNELFALRDITPGTEITFHYGDEWQDVE